MGFPSDVQKPSLHRLDVVLDERRLRGRQEHSAERSGSTLAEATS
jgi:hypothetical protein